MIKSIEEKLAFLPAKPGVYIMRDGMDNIIYVGKAKILKNRVRQYFRRNAGHNNKTARLVENIRDLSWIVTDSEIEALILECNLIKRHRPKYNILLKDDKTFPYIKITVAEKYPRLLFSRKLDDKKAKYFGPYTNSGSVRQTLDLFRKTFQIRSCNTDFSKKTKRDRACIYYHMNQCAAPCVGYITEEGYRKKVKDVIDFLEGRSESIIKRLEVEMQCASDELRFEQAADLRDKITHLKNILKKQNISVPKDAHYDVLGFFEGEKTSCVTILFVRGGKLLGSKSFCFSTEDSKEIIITELVKQFYDNADAIPKEIILPFPIPDKELIEKYISEIGGRRVIINVPQKGRKKELVNLSIQNAKESLAFRAVNKSAEALNELKELLKLEAVPERIEVYDISNTAGADIVGFMTVFEGGAPRKSEYRRFKMKYTEAQDDYACMYEVIYRRLLRYLEEQGKLKAGEECDLKFINLPDLIFVDGGMNHVKVGKQAVEASGLAIPVFGLVKDGKHKTRDITSDSDEYQCYKRRAAFHMISKMQEETHEQAVKYHHTLRSKVSVSSELLSIEGVGEVSRKKLFAHFGSIEKIKESDIETLSHIVPLKIARRIHAFYHKQPYIHI